MCGGLPLELCIWEMGYHSIRSLVSPYQQAGGLPHGFENDLYNPEQASGLLMKKTRPVSIKKMILQKLPHQLTDILLLHLIHRLGGFPFPRN